MSSSEDAEHHPLESIEMDSLSSIDRNALTVGGQQSSPHRKDYFIGIGLLMLVVILWTSSNFVTQDLYEGGYDKPFLVTYMNTSAFSLYLIPYLIRRWWARRELSTKPFIVEGSSNEYQPLAAEDEHLESSLHATLPSELSVTNHIVQEPALAPLTDRQTAHLAFTFCLIWFIANWSVNASLGYTSVASATVLSSMSGFFTLAIGRLFRVETLTFLKIGAVCTSFVGVLLVSISDSETNRPAGPASHPIIQTTVDSRATIGDVLALISALCYAMYVILLKVRIKSESRIDVQLFFGFVGLLNILVCWPIGVVHLTGAEVFELPPTRKALSAVLINMAITLSSDYLYVIAMLKTTPLVVTIGLSLTIPVAVLGDFARHRPTHIQVIAGAILVLCSFVAVGFEDSKEQEAIPVSSVDEAP
ncbi:hypothetical protein GALMADRAFT_233728 [Galerina marginata CBS 339.88]|uniref:Uncharacterized protein n=1 Tax=Galerina marginata (strain CBS 339.88) TaxID=685588 RepID=A0A067TS04_GALM3|nr:hypothetical protein GALMADRAFT_233728 [Galerina marginata CBS 339.88]